MDGGGGEKEGWNGVFEEWREGEVKGEEGIEEKLTEGWKA